MTQKKLLIILILVLAMSAAIFGVQTLTLQKELAKERAAAAQNALDRQAISFLQAFVDKVIGAQGAVSFNDRLTLETMVRGLNDDTILAAWTNFVNSQNQADAQAGAKSLLKLLAQKIGS